MLRLINFSKGIQCLVSIIIGLGVNGCAPSLEATKPTNDFAPFGAQPGGEAGPSIPLDSKKAGKVSVNDPEAATFLTKADVTEKAARVCGLDAIVYDQAGPELIFGTGQTANLIYSRALLLWCRAYDPKPRRGAVLRVKFSQHGDLIYEVSARLESAQGLPLGEDIRTPSGFQMIQAAFNGAGVVVKALSGKPEIGGSELFKRWCAQNPVDMNFWPSPDMHTYGEAPHMKTSGDPSQLYSWGTAVDDCELADSCRASLESPRPKYWVGSQLYGISNPYPRPGVLDGTTKDIVYLGYWSGDNPDQYRLRVFRLEVTRRLDIQCEPTLKADTMAVEERQIIFQSEPTWIRDHLSRWRDVKSCSSYVFTSTGRREAVSIHYKAKLSNTKYGSAYLSTDQIILPDERSYLSLKLSIPSSPTAGFTWNCYTTVMN